MQAVKINTIESGLFRIAETIGRNSKTPAQAEENIREIGCSWQCGLCKSCLAADEILNSVEWK